MGLTRYHSKRHFQQTAEPAGKLPDRFASSKDDILDVQPRSVLSGRSMDQIAAGADEPGHEPSLNDGGTAPAGGADPTSAASLPGARPEALPESVKPQLATLVDQPPAGDEWLHEIKYDGYRILAAKSRGGVRLITRGGKNWSDRFAGIADALAALPADEFWLDGEMVVTRRDGTTDFQALQNVLGGLAGGRIHYVLFDIIYLNGIDLSQTPLLQRKQLLHELLRKQPPQAVLRYSDHIIGSGALTYRHACRQALEGIVSKRMDAAYRQKRSMDWVKTKCLRRQEFVVAGFSAPSGSRVGFGALLLGYYDASGDLRYAGRVGSGFDRKVLRALAADLAAIRQVRPALVDPPGGAAARGVTWVAPERVVEVAFTQWTEEGRLRHPVFKGLREDKPAAQIVRERPMANTRSKSTVKEGSAVQSAKASSTSPPVPTQVAGIQISHPGRVLYPDQGATKVDLAHYYQQVAERMLPHVAARPLSIVRCPKGRQGKCFYQKHLTDQLPEAVKGVAIEEKAATRTYLTVEDLAGIVALVQLGTLEFHPWGSQTDRLERPDRMVFDLDPGPGVTLKDLQSGCRLLHRRLTELGLTGFLKTSGGKGFHIVVPLIRRSEWDDVKAFSKALAEDLTRRNPQRFVATMTKSKRQNRIFVDYLRNSRGATSVAPFSTRARSGAPVSAPLAWEELDTAMTPDRYTIATLPRRLAALQQDPWAGFFDVRQSITVAMKRELVEGG